MEKIVQNIKNEIGNNKVVACISTGPDSMVLLTLLEQALNKNQIIVAHVNHNVRRQSIEEEAFIKEYCENNNLVYKLLSLEPTNSNFEEYARTKRYEFFIDTAHLFDAKYILTGHNADDQVETILRRMISKSSLKGFAGIEKISNFKGFKIYRPLLDVSKKDITTYANEQNITYFVDETNDSLQNQRSRIRNLITPLLLEENPNLYDAVKYYSDSLISASNEINHIRDSFIKKYIKFDNDTIKFNINDLLELTEYMQKEVLFEILKKYNLSVTCINETLKKINSNKSNIATTINDYLNMIDRKSVV